MRSPERTRLGTSAAFKQIGPHTAVILPQRGEPLLVMTPSWDAARYRERATMESRAVAPEEFLDTVAAELKGRSFRAGKVAVAGGNLQPRAIADAWPAMLGAAPRSAEKLIVDTSKIRDEWSLNCTRRGVAIAERGYDNLLADHRARHARVRARGRISRPRCASRARRTTSS